MASPEYTALMKELTRYRLAGLAANARAMENGIRYEIESIKHIIDINELSPEICQELLDEFQTIEKEDAVSRPLRGMFQKLEETVDEEVLEDSVWKDIESAWDAGDNILIKGGAGNRKTEVIFAACKRYQKEHPEIGDVYYAVRKCSKRTSEMGLCYGRRRYVDNRFQLGYIAEGMLLAKENPQDIVALVLDEVEAMDLIHALAEFWKLLEQKGREKMICHSMVIPNCKNFMLFATENAENGNRNIAMDSAAIRQMFREVNIWNSEMEQHARHRMI